MAKQSPKSQKKGTSIKEYLESLTSAELVSYILELARATPEVERDLQQRAVLASGDTGELLRETRKELRSLAAENYWNDDEDRYDEPDYGHLKTLFERLLAAGQADALLDMGRELLEKASRILESSEAEELDENLLACFTAIFQAVPSASRPDVDKMLYLIDLSLTDEHDLTDGMNFLFEREWPTAVWSAVADEMNRRLAASHLAHPARTTDHHDRDELCHWLAQALEAAGRENEVLPLLEREAVASGAYLRLVDALIAEKRWDDARRWILEGLAKTPNPAWSANTLRDRWRSVAEHENDWATVAAMAAASFFRHPSSASFRELMQAAKKASCEEPVRAAALRFLETGIRPEDNPPPPRKSPSTRSSAKKAVPAPDANVWPLPALPAVVLREMGSADAAPGPRYDVLLDLALEDKQPDEVLRWYDRLAEAKKEGKTGGYGWSDYRSQVAEAVAATHTDWAVATYRELIAEQIAFTKVSAYESAEPYLVKLKALLTRNKRAAEWTQYLTGLRETHARKPRLLEVLDRVAQGRSKR